jgi:predicted aminopeptidase
MSRRAPAARLRAWLLRIAVGLVPALLGGCYLVQVGVGQLDLLARRRAITAVVADPSTPPAVRERLEYVRAARDYASRELGLPENGSYSTYVQLDRAYVVWNVFAAPRYALEPHRWCFPIAGCVVYRGYFDRDTAEAYAARLRRRGEDTAVVGVPAYSTLGHFEDPVLSSMMRYSDAQLAATIFHELAHQMVYIPGDSQFNEAFATVVEEAGLRRWLASRGDDAALIDWQRAQERAAGFRQLLLDTQARLRRLYAAGGSDIELWQGKQQTFGELKTAYARLREQWGGYAGYDSWFDRALNNADLVPVATYHRCVPGLERLLADVHGDLAAFYAAAKSLTKLTPAARAQQICPAA